MSNQDNKEEQLEMHLQNIDRYISFPTPLEAINSLSTEDKFNFLTDYYSTESLNYNEELSKKLEEQYQMLENELKQNKGEEYTKELIMIIITLCKTKAIDQIVDQVSKIHSDLRDKLKPYKITDFKATMTYQLATGNIAMKYNTILSQEIKNECISKKLNFEQIISLAMPFITNDFSVYFEIDGYVGLKNYETSKNKPITKEQVLQCSKKTIEYANLLLEEKIPPQSVMIFPSMMNQYLIIETGLDNYQIIGKIVAELKEDNRDKNLEFYNQILEEIWYVERCRGLIFHMFRQQMEMMEAMMSQNPEMMAEMAKNMPNQMGGHSGDNMEGIPGMGNSDMEALRKAMENMDVEMLEKMMPMGNFDEMLKPKP